MLRQFSNYARPRFRSAFIGLIIKIRRPWIGRTRDSGRIRFSPARLADHEKHEIRRVRVTVQKTSVHDLFSILVYWFYFREISFRSKYTLLGLFRSVSESHFSIFLYNGGRPENIYALCNSVVNHRRDLTFSPFT